MKDHEKSGVEPCRSAETVGKAGGEGQGALVERKEWLIRKGGYFYRPNSAGYTTRKIEAGRYTKTEAEKEAAIEPWHMSAIHQDEVPDEPAVVSFNDRIEALARENAALRADKERAERERDYAVGKEREVAATIKRVWAALGNPEFEALHGRTISEVVADWKDRAEAAEARVKELERRCDGCAGYECEKECAYPGVAERRLAEQGQVQDMDSAAKSLGILIRDWVTGPRPWEGDGLEKVIAGRLRRLFATSPSPEPDAELAAALEPFAEVAAWAERNGHNLVRDFDMLLRGPGEKIAGHLHAQSAAFVRAYEILARHRKQGGA